MMEVSHYRIDRKHCALYLVIGIKARGGHSASDIVEQSIQGGVTMVQLREKEAPLRDVLAIGGAIRDVCRRRGVPFVVNDRVDVALLLEADGVHVGQTDLPCGEVRRLAGPDLFVGVSAGTTQELEYALESGADYVGIGSVYPTGTKADAGDAIGVSLIRSARAASNIPIVGIGGIDVDGVPPVIEAGADGVAVVSAIYGKPDPFDAATRLRFVVDQANRSRNLLRFT